MAGSQALAGAFHLNERSAAALGASLSGSVSSARDVTFATFNPAALKTVEKFESGGNISAVLPIAEGTFQNGPLDGTDVDGDLLGVVPSLALGYRLNNKLVVGFTTYAPFGLSTDFDKDSPVQADARESDLLTVSISPSVAYSITDNLTFGASLDVLYAEARLSSNGGALDDIELDGNDWGVSFSAGLLFEPIPGTQIGAAYHHGYDLKFPTDTFLGQRGNAQASLPGWAHIGVTQRITDDLRHLDTRAGRHAIRLVKLGQRCAGLQGFVLRFGWHRVRHKRSTHRPGRRGLGRDPDHRQAAVRARAGRGPSLALGRRELQHHRIDVG
jgi:long-chain fatty acid transport protein